MSERLDDRLFDFVTSHSPGHDLAVGADQNERRDRHDAELAGDRAVDAAAKEGLSPWQLALLLEFPGLLDLLVDAEAEDREPRIPAEGVLDGLELGNLGQTRAAPG